MVQNVEKKGGSPPNCAELLQRFEKKEALHSGKKLRFSGVDEHDVYNISAPFHIGNATVIAGRVEAREARSDSRVIFFEEKNGIWTPTNGAPILRLEDGFATHIGDETIFGGVEVYPDPATINSHDVDYRSRSVGYRTVFYRGHDLSSLQKFAVGPDMMKDIRLMPLVNGRIGVFTRPQGGSSGKGKIGYIELQRLEEMNADNILSARVIENQFAPEEWGGANELHPLPDGMIGVIGHIAYQDAKGGLHYHAMSFVYDPKTHCASPIEIIATRKNFPAGDAKASELADVIFPGGLVRHGDDTATLYVGLSDAEAGSIILPDPFGSLRQLDEIYHEQA
ncbi:MAG: hypothetical protein A3F94_01770 [Candidatus Spechtbacteria bacterium RIFCSPLOWO2_12_FULL_38_22]|uniref:DUF1861 domain-containing protein n=1 Tax=Candidatus Spechtbacteria bacterium RIFCSPLOWO2_12_FULL_38_22 TaxID=1802165 RepID=A0A1G2HJU6_9BACT|nr:MAG: hypothetical protein A3A00_01605 [Candidatus Spechtbacteria bacterium RIFCSPLOWO2_01_FULL_38_20]OGZ60284.1 MAG: hypothetical protein A3E58_01235 [Candidatus Spechtbacteria bacterium RIFCSPHIGHO2_12_FULL_38_30]OGZ62491.1 MAG: hypothetical protein A3F94_01770 [Candidatus Spechtbacteria bacterium RIFCSPLOWO2_12_FULL_38_22]